MSCGRPSCIIPLLFFKSFLFFLPPVIFFIRLFFPLVDFYNSLNSVFFLLECECFILFHHSFILWHIFFHFLARFHPLIFLCFLCLWIILFLFFYICESFFSFMNVNVLSYSILLSSSGIFFPFLSKVSSPQFCFFICESLISSLESSSSSVLQLFFK